MSFGETISDLTMSQDGLLTRLSHLTPELLLSGSFFVFVFLFCGAMLMKGVTTGGETQWQDMW